MATAPLEAREVVQVVGTLVTLWCLALLALHLTAAPDASNFWGTLPSAWDHPEPNYLVSAAIGEFWSVLTTIPVAGALLFYEGCRFQYGRKVMLIYGLTCCMYSLACSAHLTLQRHVFATTVTAVMSNALLTFVMFSHVVHKALQSLLLRGLVVLVAETLLVTTVACLPYMIKNGGVWTLFVVQAPGVFLATGLAMWMALRSTTSEEKTTYRLVSGSGMLLSSAMVLSLVECLIGFEWGFWSGLWGFPYLHVAIHLLEQFGIYVFGVGVAALEVLLLRPKEFQHVEVRSLGKLSYLYCELKSTSPLLPAQEPPRETARGEAAAPEVVKFVNGQVEEPRRALAPLEVERARKIHLRKRTQSPGVAALRPVPK
ncbi:unnamed protein product [Durusdinium trenchii]|uniref:Uncharacterized protein n=2 Tax=Durusdinium trenchii TaxID=1381693 RepID=A0ABP0NSU0_9DINO